MLTPQHILSLQNRYPGSPVVQSTMPLHVHPLHLTADHPKDKSALPAHNLLRDTLLRYLGYANEFTEAGISSGVKLAKTLNPFAWFTVFAYGIADALNQSIDKHTAVSQKTGNEDMAKAQAISHFGKEVLFHTAATWYGPVYLAIKPVGKLTEVFFQKVLKKRPTFWPTVAGLAMVPVIPKLFDPLTEKLLEKVYNPISASVIRHTLKQGFKNQSPQETH